MRDLNYVIENYTNEETESTYDEFLEGREGNLWDFIKSRHKDQYYYYVDEYLRTTARDEFDEWFGREEHYQGEE